MEPIKHKAYQEVLKLFEALTTTKIIAPSDVSTQYNLLNQIFTITYFWMDKDIKTKHRTFSEGCLIEMVNRLKGKKDTFFNTKENEWERELRCFCLEKMKEDEFGVEGL